MALLVKEGFGQLEPNHLSAQETGKYMLNYHVKLQSKFYKMLNSQNMITLKVKLTSQVLENGC